MKIECECGGLIHDGTDDLPHKAHFIPDQKWNAMFEALDVLLEKDCGTARQREAACTKVRQLVGGAARMAWQCGTCGRLYIDDANFRLHCYEPETPKEDREILRGDFPQ